MLLHIEGFEYGFPVGTYMGRKFTAGSTGTQISNYGRFGGQALRWLGGTGLGLVLNDESTLILGWAHFCETMLLDRKIIHFYKSAGEQVTLRHISGGTLGLYIGAIELDRTLPSVFKNGVWQYIEFKITFHATTGSYELRIDDDVVMSGSGADTFNTSTVMDTIFWWPEATANNCYIDDMYVLNASGSLNNDFLGDQRVVGSIPNGVGDSESFTPYPGGGEDNYQNVDEGTAGPDDNTTYVESSTIAHLDLYEYTNLSSVGDIAGIQVFSDGIQGGGFDLLQPCKYNGTQSDGSALTLTASYLIYSRVIETDPDGGVAWTTTSFNSAQFGVKVD